MLSRAAPDEIEAVPDLTARAFAGYAAAMGQDGAGRRAWLEGALAAGEVWWIGDRAGVAVLHRDGTTLKVGQIAIDPDGQGRGQGGRAMAAIEAQARDDGATEIALHTAQVMTRLVAFYSRLGFRVQAVGPHPKGRDDRLRVFLVKSLV